MTPAPKSKRGVRFRAFPHRRVLGPDGTWSTPTYRITSVRYNPGEKVVGYRVDDAGTVAEWTARLDHLEANGFEVLP